MRSRTSAFAGVAILSIVALACGLALLPLRAEQIHRHGFNGRSTVLVRGDANVRVDENEHDISGLAFTSQPSSEHIKLTAEAATGNAAYIHYYYDTPPAPVTELFAASVHVKSSKGGVQLRARVVLPNEPDPVNPQAPLTLLIVGDTLPADKTRQWEALKLENAPQLLARHLVGVRAGLGREVNATGAYIDRLILNLYTGPGTAEVWVDDLDIGPVKPVARPDAKGAPGVATKLPRAGGSAGSASGRGRLVEQSGGLIRVDGKDRFFRAIRHTGTPLHVLRQAGFDTLWLPPDATNDLIEDANREGWLIVPTIPLLPARGENENRISVDRTREELDGFLRKFDAADVLFYDLGGGRTAEQLEQVSRTAEAIRQHDPRRPRGADVWDSFSAYSTTLDVVGAHRWPLFTNLDMIHYRDWLRDRFTLTANSRATFWTWVQNHLPEWYIENVLEQRPTDPFHDPIGPNPEQVRVMAHIALASGCRGLGFWSDRFLADSHHGRDRLQGMALLNAEIDMLSPVLLGARGPSHTQWLNTNNSNVKAALIRAERGSVLLPIWMGPGMQFVPDQGALNELKVTVPLVPLGADPWRLTPAGVESLAHKTKKEVAGTVVTIEEFDLVAPIVFTSDRSGLVAWWQFYAHQYGRLAARWALDLAAVEYDKVATVHNRLAAMNVTVPGADALFRKAVEHHEQARMYFASELYDKAYQEATRALRSLRVVMTDHWKQATATLDTPTASPYAVSYFTLPKHWELFAEMRPDRRKPGPNVLPYGNFELSGELAPTGVPVSSLPGWSARFGTLDRVNVAAGIIPAAKYAEKPQPRKGPEPIRGPFAPGRVVAAADEGYVPPTPELGKSLLRLEVQAQIEYDRNGKPREPSKNPLEKTFLAVDSPPVQLPPGTLVRVSGWVRVPKEIAGSADGVLFYDDAGGEPLGVRVTQESHWKQFHLYRRVPANGQISVTLALTGIGVAYFDDIRIEPLVLTDTGAGAANYGSVIPAGGVRR